MSWLCADSYNRQAISRISMHALTSHLFAIASSGVSYTYFGFAPLPLGFAAVTAAAPAQQYILHEPHTVLVHDRSSAEHGTRQHARHHVVSEYACLKSGQLGQACQHTYLPVP